MGVKNLTALIQRHAPGAVTAVAMAELAGARVAIDFNIQVHRVSKGTALRGRGLVFGGAEHVAAVVATMDRLARNFRRAVWIVDHPGPSEAKRHETTRRKKTSARSHELQVLHERAANEALDLPRARRAKRARDDAAPGEGEPSVDESALLDLERALGKKLCCEVLDSRLPLAVARAQRQEDLEWQRFQKSHVTSEMLRGVRAELSRLGHDSLMAPPGVEAEQLAADMQRRGAFDYVVSEDMDALTFGARRLLCKQTYEGFSCVNLDCLLATTGLAMPQFVDLCILCGTDFTEKTVPKVGHVGAYDLVKQHGTIEAVLEARGHGDHLDGFDFVAARAQFNLAIPDDYAWLLDAVLEVEQTTKAVTPDATSNEATTDDSEDCMWPDMPPEAIFVTA